MMMSFCKKSVHSLLGNFSNSKDYGLTLVDSSTTTTTTTPHRHGRGGLTFFTVPGDNLRPINVVESAAVKSPPPLSSPTASPKRDPGGIGFLDDVGGNVDGLMSCTESLGFESSDERRVDDRMIEIFPPPSSSKSKRTISGTRTEVKKFPPPLSSLDHNGLPTFFLRPVRRDGRLELTEVKVHRPEILRASRQDGRLRLNFIHDEDDEEEEEDIEEEVIEEEKEEKFVGKIEEEKEEKIIDEVWQFPGTSGGGSDGFRRCYELSHHSRGGHHHHHNLHVWSQHCVTIR